MLQDVLAILVGALLAQQNDRTETACSRLITYPVLLASVLSPFALVMNLAFPYWDFLFTLIYNLSLGRWVAEGITATFITTAMLVFAVMFSELMHRRVFCSK
jgi:Mg2+/citrate symporter